MTSEEAKKTVENLGQAKRVLLAVPNELFDMEAWSQLNPDTCGTSHCVAGWMRLDEWFQENTSISEVFTVAYDMVYPSDWALSYSPNFATCLANMIGIRTSEARVLFGVDGSFSTGHIENKRQAIRYIDQLIAQYSAFIEEQ